jgi:hypothetical protein
MKKIVILSSVLFAAVVFSSCTYHHTHTGGLPPGQAKKVTGSKSAKPYAPGQQKKH